MTAKECTACRLTKPLDGFHQHRNAADGRNSRCKACRNAQDRARYRPREARQPEVVLPISDQVDVGRAEIKQANLRAMLDRPPRPVRLFSPSPLAVRCRGYYREWRKAKRRQAS